MEIYETPNYQQWFANLRDISVRQAIVARLRRLQIHNHFGDHKGLGQDLFELRLHISSGIRLYYTKRNGAIIILLAGGDKSSQNRDIQYARQLLNTLED